MKSIEPKRAPKQTKILHFLVQNMKSQVQNRKTKGFPPSAMVMFTQFDFFSVADLSADQIDCQNIHLIVVVFLLWVQCKHVVDSPCSSAPRSIGDASAEKSTQFSSTNSIVKKENPSHSYSDRRVPCSSLSLSVLVETQPTQSMSVERLSLRRHPPPFLLHFLPPSLAAFSDYVPPRFNPEVQLSHR